MTARQLPPRPNLDQLKRQAKDLLREAQRPQPGARARFCALPVFASVSDEALQQAALALHDAQSVIAREHGFDSWKALCERVEELTLEFDAAVDQFLDAGADPNDGVTLPMAASAGDIPVLEALLAHGAKVDQAWATDGSTSLYAILNWSRTPDGAAWLLDHGADPNAVFTENGEIPLHAVARAWDVPLAQAMVAHGADVERRRADGRTPYAVAELSGNRAVADWLLAQGASPEMTAVDRLVATCSRGERAAAEALVVENPGLRDHITDDHYITFHQAAERGDVPALEAMLACGFDPNRPDSGTGKTALHSAAMAGWPDAVRLLLAHGGSVHVRDREFNGQPLIWPAEGSRTEHRQGRDSRRWEDCCSTLGHRWSGRPVTNRQRQSSRS